MTLKDLVYKILLENPETRDSDKKLIWEIWRKMGLVKKNTYSSEPLIYESDFLNAPSTESCRRVRQQLQREDNLLCKNLIKSTPKVKERRFKLSKEHGASFIIGKQPIFNPETNTYEI